MLHTLSCYHVFYSQLYDVLLLPGGMKGAQTFETVCMHAVVSRST